MYAQEPTNIRRKHTRVYTLHNTTPLTNMRNNASWSFIPSSSFHCACILPLFPSLPDLTCRRRNHCLHKLILQNRHVNRHRLPRSAVPVDGTKCYHRLVCLLSQQLHHFFSLLFLEESAVVAVAVSTAAAVAQMIWRRNHNSRLHLRLPSHSVVGRSLAVLVSTATRTARVFFFLLLYQET